MLKKKTLILLILIIALACKDEFLLESKAYKPILVVDGLISNEPPPYTVELSLSSPITTIEKYPFQRCTVILNESTGKSETLTEIKPGVYNTASDGIQGIIGNKYSISITTPEGKEYISEPGEIKQSVGIDTIYAELVYLDDIEYVYGLPGYQFYMNSETASTQDNFLLWKMIETYQYTSIHKLFAIWDGVILHTNNYGMFDKYINRYRCWKTENVKMISTAKTSNLSIPKISNHPLHFVGTDTRKLQERYSLLLKQYAIGETDYYYWKGLEDLISQENFLIANQPYNLVGNIRNTMDKNEQVFGNFTVASVTEKRIFLDPPRATFYYTKLCYRNYDYKKGVFIVIGDEGRLASVKEGCIDCTYFGGVTNKPDFWVDK